MKKYVYRVTFEIKKNGSHIYALDIEADKAAEAKTEAKHMWYDEAKSMSHMFGIEVRKLRADEPMIYNWFYETGKRN